MKTLLGALSMLLPVTAAFGAFDADRLRTGVRPVSSFYRAESCTNGLMILVHGPL